MIRLKIIACKFAIVIGIAEIAYATTTSQIGVVPISMALSLIAAGIVVWRGGPVWLLTAIWSIATVWFLLPFATFMFEGYRVGTLAWDPQASIWGGRFVLCVAGLAMALLAQRDISSHR